MARLSSSIHPLLVDEVLECLFSKKIYTTVDFVNADPKNLSSITCLPYKDISTIRKYVINKHSAVIKTGDEYHRHLMQNTALVKTGIENFDKLFNGGLMTGNIYEICGFPATGKTQFCLTIAKTVAQKLQQIVYYIDTKRDFSGMKIYDMLNYKGDLDENSIGEIMNRILVKFITTKHDLVNSLHAIKDEVANKSLPHQVRLIVIDSMPPLFQQSSDHTLNNSVLNHAINTMRFMAKEYHMVFVVTNVITQWYDMDNSIEPLTETPALGKYWQNIPNTRFHIRKNENSCYEISILESTCMKTGLKCKVSISDGGMS